jgi:hypothetical protein
MTRVFRPGATPLPPRSAGASSTTQVTDPTVTATVTATATTTTTDRFLGATALVAARSPVVVDRTCAAAADLLRGIEVPALTALVQRIRSGVEAAPVQVLRALSSMTGQHGDDVQAALELVAHANESPRSPLAVRVLSSLSTTTPAVAGTGNDRPGVGDLQNHLVAWARVRCPALLTAAVGAVPELSVPMPVLEQAASRLHATYGEPLRGFNTLIIGHVLGEMGGYVDALEQLGLDKATTSMLAVPYSSNELAIEAIRARGYHIDNPQGAAQSARSGPRWGEQVDANTAFRDADPTKSFDALKRETVRAALQRMLDHHDHNGRPILVIDDGGYAAKVAGELLSKDQLAQFRFVEQTTRGMRQVRDSGARDSVVVDVAGSGVKRYEDPFVADLITDSLQKTLTHLSGGDLRGRRVAVLGYGNIGAAVVARLRAAGADVVVYDRAEDVRRRAAADGCVVVDDKEHGLRERAFVVGTTGNTALSPEEFLLLENGCTLVSTSSVDVEFRSSWTIGEELAVERRRVVDALRVDDAPLPKSPHLDLQVRVDAPGTTLDGRTLTDAELGRHRVTRAFVETLQGQLQPFARAMNVQVKARLGPDPRIAGIQERILGAVVDAQRPPGTAAPALAWAQRDVPVTARPPVISALVQKTFAAELLESSISLTSQRGVVWLANGGYPVNLSRRLQSMPPERIQVTLAALVAGAVQATTTTTTGIQPLDRSLQENIARDFCSLAPGAHARATAGRRDPVLDDNGADQRPQRLAPTASGMGRRTDPLR